ncbi:MAG: hypothetical protein NTV05_11715 [Acidobacteria bacterium]|nr:hypothetical protein [Acidobacteriota bacterium]
MASFAGALRALNQMKDAGVIEEYAVAGAMAVVFWSEPIPTFDLDVLVFLPESASPIVSLDPIYQWTAAQGYPAHAEHVLVEQVPVQFLPAHSPLADEAIERAAALEYEGVPVRVVRPEYLIALYLEPGARTLKRRERAAALRESASVDVTLLDDLLARYRLEP